MKANKALDKKLATALGWTRLVWEEGYSRDGVHCPTGWRGVGPHGENAFFDETALLNAWQKRDFATLRTMIEVAEKEIRRVGSR